ncbi:MAG: ribonuclease P protein component [bacterium]
MLSKKYRLTRREDFSKVFSKGAYARQDELSIKYAKNSLPLTRIGFPIGKNYSKKAVVRNRTRRVLQAAFDEITSKITPGFDIVVIISPGYQKIELKKISGQLQKILYKANLFM